MAIVINGNGIDMGNNPVSNASRIDGVVINENGDNVATLVEAKSYDIGVEQIWQNMTASRALDVTYTNNTEKPISVSVFLSNNVAGYKNVSLYIDNKRINSFANQPTTTQPQGISLTGIVPSGSTYKLTLDPSSTALSVTFWNELR